MFAKVDEGLYARTVSSLDAQSEIVNGSGIGITSVIIENAEGEVNMLIGFFVMNGVYIALFLLFGSCVMCSCLQRLVIRRHKYHTENCPQQQQTFNIHLERPTAISASKHRPLETDLSASKFMDKTVMIKNREAVADMLLQHNGCLPTTCSGFSAPLNPCNVLYSEL